VTDSLSYLIIAEFVLPPLLLSGILLWMFFRRRGTQNKIAEHIAEKSAVQVAKQHEQLVKWLETELGYEGEELNKASQSIMDWRNAMYKNYIHGLLKQDTDLLKGLPHDFSLFFSEIMTLKNSSGADEAAREAEAAAAAAAAVIEAAEAANKKAESQVGELTTKTKKLVEDLESLKTHSQGVEQEKEFTLKALNNIFSEYMTMFGEELETKDLSVEQIVDEMDKIINRDGSSKEIVDEPPDFDMIAEEPTALEGVDFSDDEEMGWEGAFDSAPQPDIEALAAEAELDSSDSEDAAEEAEPNWGDAFAESGDTMESPLESEPAQQPPAKEETAIEEAEEEEPSWEDAFTESGDELDEDLVDTPAKAEAPKKQEPIIEAEEEPSWEDAFSESGDELDEALAEETAKPEKAAPEEDIPGVSEADEKPAKPIADINDDSEGNDLENEKEPSWEDAFAEDTPDNEEAEPSWEDAFSEIASEGDSEEPSWEDAFSEIEDKDP
jgi:hypothetical protein